MLARCGAVLDRYLHVSGRDTHRESGKSGSGVLCLCKNVRGNRGPRSYIPGCTFTLYVDDMTFSSQDNFSWKKLAYEVDGVLHKYGHRAKGSKTKYRLPGDFKIVTGVCLAPDGALVAPNKLRSKIVGNTRSLKASGDLSLLSRIQGQIQAADYVEGRRTFPGIRSELERIAEAAL